MLLSLSAFALAGCGEAERRADRVADLRKQAERGLAAVERFCEERDMALEHFNQREPGWDQALEEVLRASDPLTDYCETEHAGHEHGEPLEGGFRRPPPDTT